MLLRERSDTSLQHIGHLYTRLSKGISTLQEILYNEYEEDDIRDVENEIKDIADEIYVALTGNKVLKTIKPQEVWKKQEEVEVDEEELDYVYVEKHPVKGCDGPDLILASTVGTKSSKPYIWESLSSNILKFDSIKEAKAFLKKYKLNKAAPGYGKPKLMGYYQGESWVIE